MGIKGKRLLVTGGLGFIGSHFVDVILSNENDIELIVLDAGTYCASQRNLVKHDGSSQVKLINGSVLDSSLLGDIMGNSDWVVHFAGETHVDRSLGSAESFFETNVMGTLSLLECCRKSDLEGIIIISSDEVYGSTEYPVPESVPLNPSNPYAVSKASMDLLSQNYHLNYDLPICVVRPTNNYGPRQFPEKLIPCFVTKLLSGEPIPIYGEGNNKREWLYVRDTCLAIYWLMSHSDFQKQFAGEVFNIGSGIERSVNEIAQLLCEGFQRRLDKTVAWVPERPCPVRRHAVDSSKITELTGWMPKMGLEKGLSLTISWYRDRWPKKLLEWWI